MPSNLTQIMQPLINGSVLIISFKGNGLMKPSPLSGVPKNSTRFRLS